MRFLVEKSIGEGTCDNHAGTQWHIQYITTESIKHTGMYCYTGREYQATHDALQACCLLSESQPASGSARQVQAGWGGRG